MAASKELFIKMSEEEYFNIPEETRESHLRHKVYSESAHDFNELMEDEMYARLYKEKRYVSKELDERQYYLREQKRKNK